MTNTSTPINERFERLVIFRLARWLPLGMGGLAVVALVICIAVLLYTISPSIKPSEPTPLPSVAPISLTINDLKETPANVQSVKTDSNEESAPAPAPTPIAESDPQNPMALALMVELGKLRQIVTTRGLAFVDITRMECSGYSDYDGSCYHQEEVIAQKGIANDILAVVALYDDSSEDIRKVLSIPNSELTLNLRLDSMLEVKVNILKELNGILAKLNAKDTDKYLHAWVRIRTEKELAQRTARAEKAAEELQKYEQALSEHTQSILKKKAMQWTTFLGLMTALGVLVFSGLVLAVIAIERHGRAIQALIVMRHEPIQPMPIDGSNSTT